LLFVKKEFKGAESINISKGEWTSFELNFRKYFLIRNGEKGLKMGCPILNASFVLTLKQYCMLEGHSQCQN